MNTDRFLGEIDACLFDLDGTLLDSQSVLEAVFWQFVEERGLERDRIAIDEFTGLTVREIATKLHDDANLKDTPADLAKAYIGLLQNRYCRDALPFDGAADLLDGLRARGIRLALVTAAQSSVLDPVLRRLGWVEKFDAIVPGESVARGKPFPDGYQSGLRQLAIAADRALAVEDSFNGIIAARRAGLMVVGVGSTERAERLRSAGAEAVIPAVRELAAMFNRVRRSPP